ncbi:uncharacterized protein [Prorops nasuta]|uniref:uncharacterized protein n=1 Tax=Prorops nasuta TaxID=863751 RepID=UPI0034CF5E26
MLNCPFCDNQYNNMTLHFAHLKVKHSFHFNNFVRCKQPSCCRVFSNVYTYKKHMRSKHAPLFNINSQNNLDNNINGINVNNIDNNIEEFNTDICNNNNDIITNSENICNDDIIDIEKLVKNAALSFIGKLYSQPLLNRSVIQQIIEITSELFSKCSVQLLQSINGIEKSVDPKVKQIFNIISNPFKRLETEYLRQKYLLESGCFVKPQPFFIKPILHKRKHCGTEKIDVKSATGQFISMREVLKQFLELPNIYEQIVSYMETMEERRMGTIGSFLQAELWSKIKIKFNGKIVLPLAIYYDDLEINNPIGSHASVQKIGVIYYKILSLPPEYFSLLENVLLASIHRVIDRKDVLINVFKPVVNELKFLEEKGIAIETKSGTKQIFFATALICGDNLGLHSILGFHESFNSNFYCRFCREHKDIMHIQVKENKTKLRNLQNYTHDVEHLTAGVKEDCLFNSLSCFHVTDNLYCDIMHDCLEGICRYEIPLILNYLININKLFSLEKFNEKLKFFCFGLTITNKFIPQFTKTHLSNSYYICSSSEMHNLLYLLSFIIGDTVPDDNQAWKIFMQLRCIMCILLNDCIDEAGIEELERLISIHLETFKNFFSVNLKPKFHFLLHYPSIIRKIGPLWPLSCIRYEAKHKIMKEHSSVIRSRVNICYSLALKN